MNIFGSYLKEWRVFVSYTRNCMAVFKIFIWLFLHFFYKMIFIILFLLIKNSLASFFLNFETIELCFFFFLFALILFSVTPQFFFLPHLPTPLLSWIDCRAPIDFKGNSIPPKPPWLCVCAHSQVIKCLRITYSMCKMKIRIIISSLSWLLLFNIYIAPYSEKLRKLWILNYPMSSNLNYSPMCWVRHKINNVFEWHKLLGKSISIAL